MTSIQRISSVVVVTADTNAGLSTLITEVTVSQSQRLLALTVALRLSGLIGTASHPDMQKIRIIGFFFENRLHCQFEVEKISTNTVLSYINKNT
jgi:hypothetical protein